MAIITGQLIPTDNGGDPYATSNASGLDVLLLGLSLGPVTNNGAAPDIVVVKNDGKSWAIPHSMTIRFEPVVKPPSLNWKK